MHYNAAALKTERLILPTPQSDNRHDYEPPTPASDISFQGFCHHNIETSDHTKIHIKF
jgi:hypothetical protein